MTERAKKKRIDELNYNIASWTRGLENKDLAQFKSVNEHYFKNQYIELIKESIKHGEPVPEAVIRQRPEFRTAKDNRERYRERTAYFIRQ